MLNADNKEPLHNVTVGTKGSSRTTLTNEKGEFSMLVPSNETVLKFYVLQNTTNLNPSSWIAQ